MAALTWRRLVFVAIVLLTLGLAGVFGGMVVLMNVRPGFMGMAHFTEEHHRIHDLTFALLNGTVVVGMLAQLRAPMRNIAGQLVALIPFVALLLAVALTNPWVLSPPWLILGASTVLATMFHPVGDPVRSFALSRVSRGMLVLVVVASLAYPDVDGSIGALWAAAAIAWGLLFIGVVERGRRREIRATSR